MSMGKVPALTVWLLNCISLLSSLDERMKYGQHYVTPNNNNSFANTNQFLKDYFIYFPVKVFSVSALFSRGEVGLCPSNQLIQLIQLISFLSSLHFKSLLKIQKTIGGEWLPTSFLLTASFSQSCMRSQRQIIEFCDCMTCHRGRACYGIYSIRSQNLCLLIMSLMTVTQT